MKKYVIVIELIEIAANKKNLCMDGIYFDVFKNEMVNNIATISDTAPKNISQ